MADADSVGPWPYLDGMRRMSKSERENEINESGDFLLHKRPLCYGAEVVATSSHSNETCLHIEII